MTRGLRPTPSAIEQNVWDLITPTYFAPAAWVPDALVYIGSNSAVVSPCCPPPTAQADDSF
jgi:hypothetical protein